MTTTTAHSPGEHRGVRPARPSTRPSGLRQQLSEAERLARWEADMEATRNDQACRLALAIANRVTDAGVLCPKCDKLAPKGKFKIHSDGGWKHFSAEGCSGDPVRILQLAGISTRDAVNTLLGRPTRTEIAVPDNAAELASRFVGQRSKIRRDVFNGVLIYGQKTGGVEAAQEFYGTWHISPDAVAESGSVLIQDTKHFKEAILAKYGEDKLLDCGLFTRTARGELYCLINDRFPVVEPHRHPATGDVLYMQFRASHAQYQRYLDHKAGKRDYKGSEKIISLKGAPPAAQIGTGLPRIDQLPPGSVVNIVEGFKDVLACRTMGEEAYGLPGVGVRPPEKICQLLARHQVFIVFDGDEAGQKAMNGVTTKDPEGHETVVEEGLVHYLARYGVTATPRKLWSDMDPTDYLVASHASGKATGVPCLCPTCTAFRAKWFPAQAG